MTAIQAFAVLKSPAVRRFAAAFRFLASTRLAAALLLILACVLVWATLLESLHGREYADWRIYHSRWFALLLALLGCNAFCAAAIRFPWKWRQAGFVLARIGLLVLLVGGLCTRWSGVEGTVTLFEGERTSQIVVPQSHQIAARWTGQSSQTPTEFTFTPGPADWSAGRSLRLGESGGVHLRVVDFLRHGRPNESWVADETARGGPMVRFRVLGADGVAVAEHRLIDQHSGDALFVGPLRVQLEQAANDAMEAEFQQPSSQPLPEQGLLTMYYEDAVRTAPVGQNLGKRIRLDDRVAVELVEYLPHAVPDRLGNFVSKGDLPKNPLVELRVFVDGQSSPFRQVAFAKDPFLTLDGVYGRACPVKFRYRHPAAPAPAGVEFLQARNGVLLCRTGANALYSAVRAVRPGDSIDMPGGFKLVLDEHLPRAACKVAFHPHSSPPTPGEAPPEAAVLVEVTAGGKKHETWLQRNSLDYGTRSVATPAGELLLTYSSAYEPLGFSFELLDIEKHQQPPGAGDADYSSTVRLIDPQRGLNDQRVLSINRPLRHAGFSLYASSFDDTGHGRQSGAFHAVRDPGRPLKYAGSLLICLGIAGVCWSRGRTVNNLPPPAAARPKRRIKEQANALADDLVRSGAGVAAGAGHGE